MNTNDPKFTISVTAKLLGISVHTLRMYEREGLFIPFKNSSKHRLFSQADINRIEIIRSIISKEKISINGIKTIYSLIPCWNIVNCSEKERTSCNAFSENNVLCWINNKTALDCKNANCRECSVYLDFFKCDKIQTLLKELLKEKRI
jgi:MerR family transcriptional regulator, heat shock protein HspR